MLRTRTKIISAAVVVATVGIAACSSHASSEQASPPTTAGTVVVASSPEGTISHAGRWLTDAAGRVVILHGVNMVEKSPPYYPAAAGFGEDDAAWMEQHGFNVVRLGVLATGLMPRPGVIDSTYLEHLAATVGLLQQHHIYVLFDFHQDGWGPVVGSDGFPSWMTLTGTATNTHTTFPLYYVTNPAIQQSFQSLWDNTAGPGGVRLQDRFDAMVRAIGTRFATDPSVLGYDVFNEPWPGTTWNACLNDANGCPALDQRELDPFYAGASRALRTVDHEHLLFVEPFVLFNYGESTTHVALPGQDAEAGLSFHLYPLDTAHEPKVIDNARAWSRGTTGALMDTEWGATTDPATITREAGELDRAFIPWTFWSYDELVSDLHEPPGQGSFPSAAAAALARAYPTVVAGTPSASSFDAATRTLSFSWSTRRAGGGTFPAGTVTTFEVPASAYPTGYVVVAKGAVVTSKPCAAVLTVAAQAGAASASVRVAPGRSCP
jgi:endoglycosylceramidase